MSPRLVPVESSASPESRFNKDAMARLWQNAQDRETGAEAVEEIRARRKRLESEARKPGGLRQRFRRGS
jgi:hypothetical protein